MRGVELDSVDPASLGAVDQSLVFVLVRPPAEGSHYYSRR